MSDREINLQSSPLAAASERSRRVIARNKEAGDSPFDLYRLYMHQERQEVLLRFFREIGLSTLQGLRVLDVGCGSGGHLRRMVDYGAKPANCYGIDPCSKSVAAARELNPNITFVEGSADHLPFPENDFDLIFQFTVFTSVLDAKIRKAIAAEVCRVLRPGGYFIWYDFAFSNPRNSNVRGISRRDITELLGGFRLRFRRVTLAPPIGRAVVKVFPSLYWILRAIPLLRTHYFCFAQKP
jgi:ubiquinone/menaquinone biosynthesis C-methylase UbiE